MERMVKLADVLAIINAGMFDLRSLRDNIALQEAIRSLPTVDVDLDPRGRGRGAKKEFTLYADKKPIVTFKASKIVLHGERRKDEAD